MRWFWQRKKETPEEQSAKAANTDGDAIGQSDVFANATTEQDAVAGANPEETGSQDNQNAADLSQDAAFDVQDNNGSDVQADALGQSSNLDADNDIALAQELTTEPQQWPGESEEQPSEPQEQPNEPQERPSEPNEMAPKRSWFQRLTAGLARSSNQVSQGIASIFTQRKLDEDMVEELEDVLIASDVGVAAAGRISTAFAKGRFDKEISPTEVRDALANAIADELAPVEVPFALDTTLQPHVVLVVGVNGSGKTTTIGKLAHHMSASGHSVMMAAGDTFRAAAIEQLKIWGNRTGATVIAGEQGSDPAALAFDAVSKAKDAGVDLLLIDTAGRLHNKTDLMDELSKIDRVIKKVIPDAPHSVLLVLDATIGQNALAQVKTFKDTVPLTGLIVTKLDGTAKGGVLVALANQFKLPVHAIGVGETAEDLQPFEAQDFARALVGSSQAT